MTIAPGTDRLLETRLIKNIKEGLREDKKRRANVRTDDQLRDLGERAHQALTEIREIAGRPHKASADLLQRRLDDIAQLCKAALKKS